MDPAVMPTTTQMNPSPQPYYPINQTGGAYPTQMYGPENRVQEPTTVVVTQPAVNRTQVFLESPVSTRCIYCQADIITQIHYEIGTFAWIICFVMWIVGCCFGCCLLPFCVDGCKDVIHKCPNCQRQIGRYSRM